MSVELPPGVVWKTEETKTRACWFKVAAKSPAKTGVFHGWFQSFEELRDGIGHCPVAIVESKDDADFEAVYVIVPEFVAFGSEPKFSD